MKKNTFSLFQRVKSKLFKCLGVSAALLFGCSNLFGQTVVNDDFVTLQMSAGSYAFNPTNNDELPNGNSPEVTFISGPTNGVATINADKVNISYDPTINFQGRDTIEYQLCDVNSATCDVGFIIFNVGVVPFSPEANNDVGVVGQTINGNTPSGSYDVISNDSVKEAGTVSTPTLPQEVEYLQIVSLSDKEDIEVTIITPGTKGTAIVNATTNEIEYTPADSETGTDVITYQVCHTFDFEQVGAGDYCDQADLTITINELHASGLETGDSITQPVLSIETQDIFLNNTDTEDDSLYATGFSSKLSFNAFDNTFTYSPEEDFVGSDTLTYYVCDTIGTSIINSQTAVGQCVLDSIIIVVLPAPVNDIPVIVTASPIRQTINLGETSDIITVDVTDTEDDPINLYVSDLAEVGKDFGLLVSFGGPGNVTFSYRSDTAIYNRSIIDTFKITACDGDSIHRESECPTIDVIITILDPTPVPVAVADYRQIDQGESITRNVLNNDDVNRSEITNVTSPVNGTLTTNANGDFTYTPDPTFYGQEIIEYTICRDSCSTTTFTIDVEPLFDFAEIKPIEGLSPNNDGINDVFSIEGVDYDLLDVSVKIYNRWGSLIYSEDTYDERDAEKSWNGSANNIDNENVIDGTYFYVVQISELDFTKSGNLVVLSSK